MQMAMHHHYPRNKVTMMETVEAWVVLASVIFAIWLAASDLIPQIVSETIELGFIASFALGFFFTSMLTTVPAIVAIAESSAYMPAWELALVGGLGAVCGDLLIFRFVRSRLAEHVMKACTHPAILHVGRVINTSPFWWIVPILGAIVIASPFPDELGIFMMGISHLRLVQFVPIVFVANAAGIFLIALAAQAA
jgi:hypothetical protein